jgi:hypothetical protein
LGRFTLKVSFPFTRHEKGGRVKLYPATFLFYQTTINKENRLTNKPKNFERHNDWREHDEANHIEKPRKAI